jgi:hypothetical protein
LGARGGFLKENNNIMRAILLSFVLLACSDKIEQPNVFTGQWESDAPGFEQFTITNNGQRSFIHFETEWAHLIQNHNQLGIYFNYRRRDGKEDILIKYTNFTGNSFTGEVIEQGTKIGEYQFVKIE